MRQSETISDINNSLIDINTVTQQVTDASIDTATAATNLDEKIDFLRQKLAFFNTKMSTIPSANELIKGSMIGRTANMQRLVNVGHSQIKYNEGEIIIKEGDNDATSSMFIVMEGLVDAYKNYGEYNQVYLATLEAGSVVGEMALFLKEPRIATIVAKSNVKMLEIKQDDMRKFIDDNPDIAYTLVETLCIRLSNLLKSLDVKS